MNSSATRMGALFLSVQSAKFAKNQDAYVTVSFENFNRVGGPVPESMQTETVKGEDSPRWNYFMQVDGLQPGDGAQIVLRVMDWDRFSSDDLLAEFTLDLARLRHGLSGTCLTSGDTQLSVSACFADSPECPARGVLKVRLGGFRDIPKSDAYVIVTATGGLDVPDFESYRSQTAAAGTHGVWDEHVIIAPARVNDPTAGLKFTVMDWDRLSSDDLVGEVTVTFPKLGAGIQDMWLPLRGDGKDRGHIQLTAMWSPLP